MPVLCQAGEEKLDADEVDEGLYGARYAFIARADAVVPTQPGEGALGDWRIAAAPSRQPYCLTRQALWCRAS